MSLLTRSYKRLLRSLPVTPITLLCLGYATGLLLLLASRILPRRPPFLALLAVSMPLLFAPLAVILPLAGLVRSKAGVMSAVILLVTFLVMYGPFFLHAPRLGTVHANGALTAMTFNLGADRSPSERLVSAIEDEGADIVAVQELESTTAKLMRQRLGEWYPYMVLEPDVATTGLLSRYPIRENYWFQPAGEGRPALHAVVDVDGMPVHVLVIHPLPPGFSWYRDTWLPTGLYDEGPQCQVIDIAQRADGLEGPVLVMGDFNLTDQTRAYARLSRVLTDTWREVGWGFGFTFPHGVRIGRFLVPGPCVRIDYIFHSGDICAEQARVACEGGSDHCYLVARLAFPR